MKARRRWFRLMVRALGVATLAAVALMAILVGIGHGAEIVPSLGISKPVSGGGDSRLYTGLAVRAQLAPLVKGEIGVAYRSESRFDNQLKVRSWPITASVYLTPVPSLYAGAGVGWYQTTFDYPSSALFTDQTSQHFGVHVGGGLDLPISPVVGVDLNGRYVMLRDQESRLVPEKFDPDYWTTSLGLVLKF